MDILHYRKIKTGWQAYDLNGNTCEGRTKEEARRLYYLTYKMGNINDYSRKGLLSTEDLRLN